MYCTYFYILYDFTVLYNRKKFEDKIAESLDQKSTVTEYSQYNFCSSKLFLKIPDNVHKVQQNCCDKLSENVPLLPVL